MSFASWIAALFGWKPALATPPEQKMMIETPPVKVDAPPVSASGDRGIRNNNPGNIDRDGTQWQGMAADQSSDARFIVFTSAEYGIRALVDILISYQVTHGLKTVLAMINRWAPPTENNTLAYINFVCGRMGISQDTVFDIHNFTLCRAMTEAIIAQENENYAYAEGVVAAGMAMLGIVPAEDS